ncbi:hypothetical protein RJ55_05518 [Drechmeria coniospora]|nr:hypothetical protein RJ55_05518 [Drechmeria coniospora]
MRGILRGRRVSGPFEDWFPPFKPPIRRGGRNAAMQGETAASACAPGGWVRPRTPDARRRNELREQAWAATTMDGGAQIGRHCSDSLDQPATAGVASWWNSSIRDPNGHCTLVAA